MKVRSDFVSNSSSSSFIIKDHEGSFVSRFGLTKRDFIEAFISLLGSKETYDDYVAKHKVDKWNDSPFCVLDKSLKADEKQINNGHCEYLDGWNCWRLQKTKKDGKFMLSEGDHLTSYEHAYEALRDAYDLPYTYSFTDDSKNERSIYNRELDRYVKGRIPSHVKKVLVDLHDYYGVMSNLEVLNTPIARFLFHFGDNDVWSLKGTDEPGKNEDKLTSGSEYAKEYNEKIDKSIWETESNTIHRVCEVLFKWFKDHGKLKGLKEDDDWYALYEDVIAATMHEG